LTVLNPFGFEFLDKKPTRDGQTRRKQARQQQGKMTEQDDRCSFVEYIKHFIMLLSRLILTFCLLPHISKRRAATRQLANSMT